MKQQQKQQLDNRMQNAAQRFPKTETDAFLYIRTDEKTKDFKIVHAGTEGQFANMFFSLARQNATFRNIMRAAIQGCADLDN